MVLTQKHCVHDLCFEDKTKLKRKKKKKKKAKKKDSLLVKIPIYQCKEENERWLWAVFIWRGGIVDMVQLNANVQKKSKQLKCKM